MNPQPLHRLKEFKITPSVVIPTSISRNLFTFMTLLYCRFLLHGLGTGKGGDSRGCFNWNYNVEGLLFQLTALFLGCFTSLPMTLLPGFF